MKNSPIRFSAVLISVSFISLASFTSSPAFAAGPPAAPTPAQPAPAAAPDNKPSPPPTQPADAAQAPAPIPPEVVAEAARQSDLAKQALKAKRFVQAAQLFESAAALARQPSAHTAAGLAWEQAERQDRAADAFARAIAAGETDGSVKEKLDALERTLGTLDVKAPAGFIVQLDTSTEAPAPARLHGAPGIHSLAIAAPDRPVVRRDVRLEVGKPLALALKDEPLEAQHQTASHDTTPSGGGAQQSTAPQHAAAQAPQAPPGQLRRAIGFTAVGFGAAALGATILTGLETVNARNAFNQAPTRQLYDHEQTLKTWTNIGLVAGSVLVVGGVVLIVWPSSPASGEVTVGLSPAPGGASLVGSF